MRPHLIVVGTSHHLAPVSLREALLGAPPATALVPSLEPAPGPEPWTSGRVRSGQSGAREAATPALGALQDAVRRRYGPAVVLSTCNRLEVYCWSAKRPSVTKEGLVRLLARQAGLPVEAVRPHLLVLADAEAVQHLVRVAAGLDSLALGESEILGQVRAAWLAAAARGPVGPELDAIFRGAIEAARRIRSLGAFDRHPSVAGIAVEAAAGALGGIAGRTVAVLGAGATGKAVARVLLAAGARSITLLNRSLERATAAAHALAGAPAPAAPAAPGGPPAAGAPADPCDAADDAPAAGNTGAAPDRVAGEQGWGRAADVCAGASAGGVRAATLDVLPQVLAEADALICATAAPAQLVTAEVVARALAGRSERPLVIVDIAVPRDVDPAVRALRGVRLIDLDDLGSQCALDVAARRRELDRAERLAREAAEACLMEVRAREAVPEIVALRRHAERIRAAELRRAAGRLRRLDPRERAVVEQLTHNIVQKLLHGPTVALRQTAAASRRAARAQRQALLAALAGQAGVSRRAAHLSRPEPDASASGPSSTWPASPFPPNLTSETPAVRPET